MEAATVTAAGHRPRRAPASWLRPLAFLTGPTAVLALFFIGPMVVMLVISLQYGVLSGQVGFTLSNFTDALTDPLYREVAWTTVQIATIAMLVQLAIAIPIAYVLAFKAGKWELPLLLFLVLADELNPMVRIYAWRMLLGREGLINEGAAADRDHQPADRRAAVQQVRGHRRALDQLFDLHRDPDLRGDEGDRQEPVRGRAATSAPAGGRRTRRVLLPLIAPGIFVALLLVYIPLFTDFASPTLVGGTSGYMLGQVVNDLVLESGDLNGGAAVSLLMLLASAIFALVAYKLAKIRQLET